MKLISLILGLLVLMMVSCSRDIQPMTPSIPEDRFVDYYTQSLIITQEEKLVGHDSVIIQQRLDSLQHRYHIDKQAIEQTLNYYHDDLNRWKGLNSKIIKKIQEIQRKN